MDNKNLILDENSDEEIKEVEHESNLPEGDELKELFSKQFEKIRTQSMLLGAQAMCTTILQKVITWRKPNVSRRDLERICKDIEQFCRTGLSRKVNDDGTVSPIDDAENNTKLKED